MYINNVLRVSSGNYICKYNICYLHIMCAICKNEMKGDLTSHLANISIIVIIIVVTSY